MFGNTKLSELRCPEFYRELARKQKDCIMAFSLFRIAGYIEKGERINAILIIDHIIESCDPCLRDELHYSNENLPDWLS